MLEFLIVFATEVALGFILVRLIKVFAAIYGTLCDNLIYESNHEPRLSNVPTWKGLSLSLVSYIFTVVVTIAGVLLLIFGLLCGYIKLIPFVIEQTSSEWVEWFMVRLKNSAINLPMGIYKAMLFSMIVATFKKRKEVKKYFLKNKKASFYSGLIAAFTALFAYFMCQSMEYGFINNQAAVTTMTILAVVNLGFAFLTIFIGYKCKSFGKYEGSL